MVVLPLVLMSCRPVWATWHFAAMVCNCVGGSFKLRALFLAAMRWGIVVDCSGSDGVIRGLLDEPVTVAAYTTLPTIGTIIKLAIDPRSKLLIFFTSLKPR